MFTPQEIQEKTFIKAVFGGYDMQTVDEFLEPLTEDYVTLYKENAILKSKMKVLVEKLEEYRSQEQNMRKALLSAQRTADAMVAEAEKKSAQIMNQASQTAQEKSGNADLVAAQEETRINEAKENARQFIETIEEEVRSHLDALQRLKNMDLTVKEQKAAPRQKPFDFDREEDDLPEPIRVSTQEIADEIEQNITRLMDMEEPDPAPVKTAPTDNTIKFTNLQFGRNYDPTNG